MQKSRFHWDKTTGRQNKLFSSDKEKSENADLKKGIWEEILKMQNKWFEEDLFISQTVPIQ